MKRKKIKGEWEAEYMYKTSTQSIRIIAGDCDEAETKLNYMKKHFIADDKGYLYVLTHDKPKLI